MKARRCRHVAMGVIRDAGGREANLVLLAPVLIQTKRSGYRKAEVAFLSARMKFIDRATSTTWAATIEAARRLHAEAKRVEREREAAASRAATDEGGEA